MPKVKKIRSAALESQQARHEPLGQVIEGDALRGKYAAPIRVGRKQRDIETEEEYLDPKTTQKILKLSKEQELEYEAEKQQAWLKQRRPERGQQTTFDSDEEIIEEEEIVIDEMDE